MKSNQRGFTAPQLLVVMLFLAGVVGWVMNVIEIVQTGADPITGLFIVRVIGVFMAPLGCVLGYV